MTLLMRDQENQEEGREEGRKEGRIYGAISVYWDLNLSENTILKKLEEKFQLTEEEAKEYMKNAE